MSLYIRIAEEAMRQGPSIAKKLEPKNHPAWRRLAEESWSLNSLDVVMAFRRWLLASPEVACNHRALLTQFTEVLGDHLFDGAKADAALYTAFLQEVVPLSRPPVFTAQAKAEVTALMRKYGPSVVAQAWVNFVGSRNNATMPRVNIDFATNAEGLVMEVVQLGRDAGDTDADVAAYVESHRPQSGQPGSRPDSKQSNS
jgi:hypothetical protein